MRKALYGSSSRSQYTDNCRGFCVFVFKTLIVTQTHNLDNVLGPAAAWEYLPPSG